MHSTVCCKLGSQDPALLIMWSSQEHHESTSSGFDELTCSITPALCASERQHACAQSLQQIKELLRYGAEQDLPQAEGSASAWVVPGMVLSNGLGDPAARPGQGGYHGASRGCQSYGEHAPLGFKKRPTAGDVQQLGLLVFFSCFVARCGTTNRISVFFQMDNAVGASCAHRTPVHAAACSVRFVHCPVPTGIRQPGPDSPGPPHAAVCKGLHGS